MVNLLVASFFFFLQHVADSGSSKGKQFRIIDILHWQKFEGTIYYRMQLSTACNPKRRDFALGLLSFPVSHVKQQTSTEQTRKRSGNVLLSERAGLNDGGNLNPPSVTRTLLPCCVSKGTTFSDGHGSDTNSCHF